VIDVYTMGEALGIFACDRILHEGTARLDIGGAEMNVAVGLARLGHHAAWLGRVGDDELGARILRNLRAEGVDISDARRDQEAATGLLVKEARLGSLTRVVYYRTGSAGSRLAPGDVRSDRIASARILHVTGITAALSQTAHEAVRAAVAAARSAGTRVSVDLNFRAKLWTSRGDAAKVLQELAGYADVLFASEDEVDLAELAPDDDREMVITRGSKGATAWTAGKRYDVPSIPVPVVDTVGAGDSFVAGYLSGLLEELPPEERLRRGSMLGGFTVASASDWQGLPTRAELSLLAYEQGISLR
jgi:2-dehydro-3-deoxygluconokinase